MYNLEVDADHCYRVGEQGILVHNASAGYSKCNTCAKTTRGNYDLNTRSGSFKVAADVAVDESGRTIRVSDVGGPASQNLGNAAAVCRVVEVSGILRSPPLMTPRGGDAQAALLNLLVDGHPDTGITTQTYQAGHLVGIEFGGPDDIRAIAQMFRYLNVGAWGSMERWLSGCLRSPGIKSALIEVKVKYDSPGNRALIPTQFDVTVIFDNMGQQTPQIALRFYNRSETAGAGGRSFAGRPCTSSWSDVNPPSPQPWPS